MKRPLVPKDVDVNGIIDLSLIAYIKKCRQLKKSYSIEFYTNNTPPSKLEWFYLTKQDRDEEFSDVMTYLMEGDH